MRLEIITISSFIKPLIFVVEFLLQRRTVFQRIEKFRIFYVIVGDSPTTHRTSFALICNSLFEKMELLLNKQIRKDTHV